MMAVTPESLGRVEDDGTVFVKDGDQWRSVGSFPDGSPAEALAYFVRKYEELEASVVLAEQRMKASAPIMDLKKQIEKLQTDLESPAAVGDLASLRQRVALLAEAIPEKEAAFREAREKDVAEALAYREKIVADIETLAAKKPDTIRWKDATKTVSELFEKWQAHQKSGPKLPKNAGDELWVRFKKARATLEKARRTHFAELDKRSKEAKSQKKALIEQAQGLADKGSAGIPAYRALLEKWKTAPRGSKSLEDSLWGQFKAAGDVLYSKKAEESQADDEANLVHYEEKKALIAEFQDIVTLENPVEATARLRTFHTRFQKIGPVPKKNIKEIDEQVKKFDAHVKSIEQKHWKENDPEKKARSESMAGQIEQAIERLEADIHAASGDKKKELEAELATKKAWLAVLS
jgi:hypothetical protein